MSVFSSRPVLRWLVPTAAAAVVIGGGAAVGTLAAVAEPSLPERSAAQLLVDLQTARLDGLSGTVVQTADLGLTGLPPIVTESPLGSLVAGSNTLRVWYSGPDKARVALLSTLGETDLIRDGRDVWVWESRTNAAKHYTLPEERGGDRDAPHPTLSPGHLPTTPQDAAELALSAVGPTTEVTVGRNATVAGRDAYELVLSPRDKASLVGGVRLAIDAEEHVPLRVEVYPAGDAEPAFKVAFTQVSFERPEPERFRFNPPPGVTVEEVPARAAEEPRRPKDGARKAAEAEVAESSRVVGEGWTSVWVLGNPAAEAAGDGAAAGDAAAGDRPGSEAERDAAEQGLAFLERLPKVSGDWGSGRLVESKLFTALITDDGRVLVGAVAPQRLYEVAGA